MKTTPRIYALLCTLVTAIVLLLTPQARGQVTITVQYLGSSADNTIFTITNHFPISLTGASITGVGYGGNNVSGKIILPTIAAGGQYTFAFDSSSTAFTNDFDDSFHGAAAYTLAGHVGNGLEIFSFSPNQNATGGFVPFLGNDINGNELDADVQNTLIAPTLLVNPIGHGIGGGGTIFGSLINFGTVNPGHDAPLNIQGDFAQFNTGNLIIELKSKNKFGMVNATGLAFLSGGVTFKSVHGFLPESGEQFTFLTAKNGIVGAFDTITDKSGAEGTILGLELIYRLNSVTLEFTQGSFEDFAAGLHLSPNQYSVGEALDRAVADGKSRALIRFLDNEPLSSLPRDFDKVSPSDLTSIFTIGTALAIEQSLNIQRRTDDIRSGSSGFSAAGLAINGGGPSYSGGFGITTGVAGPSGDDGKASKEMKNVAPTENRWGAFLSGTGEWVNVSGTDNARGYELASGGFTLGVDYKVCPNFAIGLMAGYTGTTADLTDHGRVWVNGGNIGVYATFFQNPQQAPAATMSKDSSKESKEVAPPAPTLGGGWYADVAATGGYSSYDTRRSALQGAARGDTDGGNLNALFGAGYDFKAGGLTFGPTATFNYTYTGTNGFTEHDSLAPLNIHGGQAESLRSAFGIKASYDCKLGSIVLKPEIRAAWQHEYGDTAYSLDSSFADGGSNFSVNGPKLGRDSALIGAGFALQCSERCSTYLYYDGELGRTNYISNTVTGGVRFSF